MLTGFAPKQLSETFSRDGTKDIDAV